MNTTELLTALQTRYATKAFDSSRKLDSATLDALLESLRLSPSSFGLQPWKFICVENSELREKLKAESWGQGQVSDASQLIVLAVKETITPEDVNHWMATLAKMQNTPLEKLDGLGGMILGFIGNMDASHMMAWNTRQVYIALGQLMTSAAVLGVDTCPLEGINPTAYDEILSLQGTGYKTVVACAVGFRSASDPYASAPKARFSKEDVIVRM